MNDAQGSSGGGAKREEANPLPSDILQKLRMRKLEPLQWVGLWLALAFFGYIILASGAIFFVSFHCLQLPSRRHHRRIPATLSNTSGSWMPTSSHPTFISRWQNSK